MKVINSGICHSTSKVKANSEPKATQWPWVMFTLRLTTKVRLNPTARPLIVA